MNRIRYSIVLLLCVCGSVSSVLAEPTSFALEYSSSVVECPDAERFADEVSANLGFVPWNQTAASKLRIRIQGETNELVGTMELPDGRSKVLRDSSCPNLFAAMVAATSVLLDSSSTKQAAKDTPPRAGEAQLVAPGPRAKVSVLTDDAHVLVSSNTETKTICVAPCTFELSPGQHELRISGNNSSATRSLTLTDGSETFLVAETGSDLLRYGGYFFVGSSVVGIVATLVGTERDANPGQFLGYLVGNSLFLGLGIGMISWGTPSLSVVDTGPVTVGAPIGTAVSYSGTF